MINTETGEMFTFIRTPLNYNTDRVSQETGLDCSEDKGGQTQQQFKEETDINTIVERFGISGETPPAMNFPSEQDFTETFDFQTSMNVIVQARESFMTLPAKTRARFQNDPQQFMEFMHDSENIPEMVKMGLAKIRETKTEEPFDPEKHKNPSNVKLPLEENKKEKKE